MGSSPHEPRASASLLSRDFSAGFEKNVGKRREKYRVRTNRWLLPFSLTAVLVASVCEGPAANLSKNYLMHAHGVRGTAESESRPNCERFHKTGHCQIGSRLLHINQKNERSDFIYHRQPSPFDSSFWQGEIPKHSLFCISREIDQ